MKFKKNKKGRHKDATTEVKNTFDGIMSRWYIIEKRILELNNNSIETIKIEKQTFKFENTLKYIRNVGELQKAYVMGISEEEIDMKH